VELERTLSICIPAFNEAEVIPELLRRLDSALRQLEGVSGEIIFVNDGSTDQTQEILRDLGRRDSRIVLVCLSRNFGHQAALIAGLHHATGDYVCLMDADLQDEPEHIPGMLARCLQGYDVVYAVRASRDSSFAKRILYRSFYRLLTAVSNVRIPPDAGDFCVMSRRVADFISHSDEAAGFLRGVRAWAGYRQDAYPVVRPERTLGSSKYSWSRLFRLAGRGVFSFSTVPLRLVTIIGFVSVLLAGGFGMYALLSHLFGGGSPSGFTALLTITIFLGGVQLLSLGIVGEYLGLMFEQSKRRPSYLVDTVERSATR
jgi:glycosyltransferase involved in cell wall biosynthesis